MSSERLEHSSIVGIKITPNLSAANSNILIPFIRYFICLAAAFGIQHVFANDLKLTASTFESSSGYFTLNWNQPQGDPHLILQQSLSSAFENSEKKLTEWQIDNESSFSVSGLNSGIYHFRIASLQQPDQWSNTVIVSVKHHSLSKAISIFAVGSVIFFLLTLLILFNHKKNRGGT